MVDNNVLARLVNEHQTNMQRVNILAQTEARKVLSVTPEMTFNQQAGYVRNTIPELIKKYGNIAALIGTNHYNDWRAVQAADLGLSAFTAEVPTNIDFTEKVDNMLGYSIAKNSNAGLTAMTGFIVKELTLHVTNYDRTAIKENAKRETQVVKIQRVAEATACAFCRTLAAAGVFYTGIASADDYVDYADDWHSECHCSTEVIYQSQDFVKPSYYDSLESDYKAATAAQDAIRQQVIDDHLSEFDGSYRKLFKAYPEAATTTKNVTAQMRIITGAN